MYIQNVYSFINKNESASYYRKELKTISKMNMRRANKFNILSLYGALHLTQGFVLKSELDIYIASEYGVINDVVKVADSIEEYDMVMPFDFLNINGNNAGFYIAKALETQGQNYLITSLENSFEQTLKLAFYKSKTKNEFNVLIGGVDESLEDVNNAKSLIEHNNKTSVDSSCWLYCSNEKMENSIAKIENVQEFDDESVFRNYINKQSKKIISANKSLQNEFFSGTQSAYECIELLGLKEDFIYTNNINNKYISIEITIL